jgi:hypothetical protein
MTSPKLGNTLTVLTVYYVSQLTMAMNFILAVYRRDKDSK